MFLQRYDTRLRGMAYALVTSMPVMDRVLRTAYLRAWREVVRVLPGEDASAWLYRLVYNGCIDELRHEAARADRPGARADRSARAGRLAQAAGEDDPLAAALARLTPEQRVAVVLVDREGFPPEGAARIAGVDEQGFAERLAVGRAALVDALPTAAPRRRDAPGRTRRPSPTRPSRSATPGPGPGAAASVPAAEGSEGPDPALVTDPVAERPPASPEALSAAVAPDATDTPPASDNGSDA